MSVEREIAGMLQSLTQKKEPDIYPATVESVEGVTCTVKRLYDGREQQNVRLSLVKNDKDGLVITPVTGSRVLVANVDKYSRFICQYSQIEKVTLSAISEIEINGGKTVNINSGDNIAINGGNKIKVNTEENLKIKSEGKIEIDAKDIEINGKENGGLVMIQELTDEINELVKVFNKHKHSVPFTTAAGSGLAIAVLGNTGKPNSKQTQLKHEAYENKKVTH